MRYLRPLLIGLGLLIPLAALAADYGAIHSGIDAAGGILPFFGASGSGLCNGGPGCGFVEIAFGIISRYRPMTSITAVLIIVIFGFRMIVGQEDDAMEKARKIMTALCTGLVLLYLIEPFVLAFYGPSGEVARGAMNEGSSIVNAEVTGVINWALVIAAVLSILMIVLSAFQAIASGMNEEGITKIRKTIFSVLFGLLLLVLRYVLSSVFLVTTSNPLPLLGSVIPIIEFFMGFLALIAVGVVIWAGIQCVISMGNEEKWTKSKELLIRVAIGAIVIVVSLAIINFIILPELQ